MLTVGGKAGWLRRTGLLSACMGLVAMALLTGAGKAPIRILRYDPNAEVVQFFEGMDSESISVRLVARDSLGGNLFIENKTNKPLTVQMPPAFAAVQVLKQFGGQQGGFGGQQGGFGGQQGGQQGGGGQGLGGGQQGGQQGGQFGGQQGGGQNLFSIPPEKIIQVPYKSICLEHGKKDPTPGMTYKVIRLEEFTDKPEVQELVKLYASGRMDVGSAQAAAWHLNSNVTWEELASKRKQRFPGIAHLSDPYFNINQLAGAQQLVAQAVANARETEKVAPETSKPAQPSRTSASSR